MINVLVYCFPIFNFPNAYINLYVPLSASDLVVTVVGSLPLPWWLNSVYLLNGLNFLVIRHYSGSLQNSYLSEELMGLLCYQNSIVFQLQGASPPWPGALPLDPAGAPPQTPVIGSRTALAMSSPTVQKKSPPLSPSTPHRRMCSPVFV